MNKSKKYKYLRKNRHSKRKTRKIQRGGNPHGSGSTAVGTQATHVPPSDPVESILPRQHTLGEYIGPSHLQKTVPPGRMKQLQEESAKRAAAKEEAQEAAAQAQAQALNQPHIKPNLTPVTEVGFKPPPSMGFSFGGPPLITPVVPAEPAVAVEAKASSQDQPQQKQQQQHQQEQQQALQHQSNDPLPMLEQQNLTKQSPAVSNSEDTPRLTKLTPEEIKKLDPEARVAYYTQNALDYNKSRERPDRRITLIAKSLPNAILGKLAGIGSDSQKNLVKEEVLTTFTGDLSKIIEDSEDQIEVIREYNRFLNDEIKQIYEEVVKEGVINDIQKQDIDDLLGHIKSNTEAMKQLTVEASQLLHAVETGNLASFETNVFGMPSQAPTGPGKSSNKPGATSSSTGQPSSSTRSGLSSLFSNNPSKDPAAAEAKAAAKAAAAAEKEARKAEAQAYKAAQLKKEKVAGLTRRKGLLGRTIGGVRKMGKTVKAGLSNAAAAARQRFSKGKTPGSPETTATAAATTATTAVTPVPIASEPKDIPRPEKAPPPPPPPSPPPPPPPLNRSPRPPPSSSSPTDFSTLILRKSNEIHKVIAPELPPPRTPSSSLTQEENTPPPPPPSSTSSSRVPPPVTPRPRSGSLSDSQQSKQSTVGNNNEENDDEIVLPKKIPKQVTEQMDPLSGNIPVNSVQVGGNKTRKNRQYIHEIKENRTQLFNKEMEIINSIRNFKHGHHHGPNENGKNKPENIQKKFIKVIKRS
jgi:hypothetical protein